MSITDKQLKAIAKLSEYSGPAELNDGEGLIAKISPKANITFQYRCRFNGKNKRIRIGKYPITTLKNARQIHKRMLELKEEGRNPEIALTGETDFVTLKDCLDYWFEHKVSTQKEGTQVLYRSVANNYFYNAFPDVDVEKITAREWMRWFDDIAKKNPKTANSAFSKMRACLNFCKSKFLIDGTHFEKIRQQDVGESPSAGERVLSLPELAKVWIAIERSKAGTSTKNLHLITMLWGNRLSELRLAKREHFDMVNDIWTVPPELSKMGNTIRRPIPKHIKPMLERLMNIYDEYLFPGASLHKPICISAANRYIRRLRDNLNLPHWRTHDFRRSISTTCSELGTMPHVTEKMLGHELVGVMAIYNKHDWLSDQKEAYEKFAEALFTQVQKELEYEKVAVS
ncbi:MULTISPECIES: site-specific integrase [Vibrio]|uniref:tyrosine-type recombinase/integrase n=1 Tax=Vibrio TaxID=662 RepID=UPI002964ADD0|nr:MULTISPECIES: site-specific integrase [unclassified Vibrio]MDW1590265.1 site-specific integrase [Vibrio sp. Vb2944]MDW1609327.1 site-specific integrase [Vibrio sp. Vb2908]MDW1723812.1 site-specific integrase [Vibrio sp. Vb2909]MDW2069566.1 site-specific integrase [Vibrio sp. 2096]MDW3140329.1 site-specific integrase [Vibrio sp. 2094]